ncbi:hypothetical protein NXV14_09175 [Bacteroides fragilis]|nr:hypothetical protein [Bacteroides fragilis]
MVDLQQYEEYWSGITERIPQIKKVVPVTFDPDMGALVQGLKADELPALLLIIPSAKGKSPDVDNLLELNLCVAFLMDKTDPQRKGTYQVLKELQPVMEKMKAQMIDDKAAGCHLFSRLDLSSLSTIPEAGFYSVFAGWSPGFEFETP